MVEVEVRSFFLYLFFPFWHTLRISCKDGTKIQPTRLNQCNLSVIQKNRGTFIM